MRFEGYQETGCGSTHLLLELPAGPGAKICLRADWMGQEKIEVELLCRHMPQSDHYGVLLLDGATSGGSACPLPPSDGAVCLEYVRIPPQKAGQSGSDTLAACGRWNQDFVLVLWIHAQSYYDDGTQLEPHEYESPPESFQPVVRALTWLQSPWKLGATE